MGAIAEVAALSRVRIHSLKLGDSTGWTSPDRRLSNRDTLTSCENVPSMHSLASATGGLAMFPVAGAAFFNRLSRELAISYAVTFLPQPGDDDGKPHRIEVDVPNAGRVTVRAPNEFVIPAGALKTTR